MTGISVHPIPIFKDNYVWAIIDGHHAVIVDPGDAAPVRAYLQQQGLTPSAILVTHHHWDHTNGVIALRDEFAVPVFGSAKEATPGVTVQLQPDAMVTLPHTPLTFKVMHIPGHTLGHIAYYGGGMLFCGDTLFSAGCGRIFEGTAPQMYATLQTLAALPDDTLVYCGHEYTLKNLQFAAMVEPGNTAITERMREVLALREQHLPSLPSTLEIEKATNPFLRCDSAAVFAELRKWKDKL